MVFIRSKIKKNLIVFGNSGAALFSLLLAHLFPKCMNCLNKSRPPWIKGELIKAIKKKKTMWRRLKNTSATPARLEKFRKFRQHVKNWIRFERKKYLTEIANEVSTNAKRFWSYFSLKNGRKSVPDKVVYQCYHI